LRPCSLQRAKLGAALPQMLTASSPLHLRMHVRRCTHGACMIVQACLTLRSARDPARGPLEHSAYGRR
jgi:hypothetical protein